MCLCVCVRVCVCKCEVPPYSYSCSCSGTGRTVVNPFSIFRSTVGKVDGEFFVGENG